MMSVIPFKGGDEGGSTEPEYVIIYTVNYLDEQGQVATITLEGYAMLGGSWFAINNESMFPLFVLPHDRFLNATTEIVHKDEEGEDGPQEE